MKNNFDLTPVIKAGSWKLVAKIFSSSMGCTAVAFALGFSDFALSMLCGVAAATVDLIILFTGIKRSMPYVEYPEQGLKVMKRFRWLRVASAACFIIVMLRMKMPVLGAFGGFLLVHIFFILNLLFIAYQLTNERNVKKGV